MLKSFFAHVPGAHDNFSQKAPPMPNAQEYKAQAQTRCPQYKLTIQKLSNFLVSNVLILIMIAKAPCQLYHTG